MTGGKSALPVRSARPRRGTGNILTGADARLRRGIIALALALLCPVSSTTCGAGAGNAEPGDRDAGQTEGVVQNARGGHWTAETTWRLHEDLRIGARSGEGPDVFGWIKAIASDAVGNVLILDAMSEEIRVFDERGSFLYRIGGLGAGPLEFENVLDMDVGPDGRLWVLDYGNGRYSVFDGKGNLSAIYPRPFTTAPSLAGGGFDPSGAYVEWISARGSLSRQTGRWIAVRFTPPDRFDTLAALEHALTTVGGKVAMEWNRFLTGGLTKDGSAWIAYSDDYTVRKVALTGDTLLTFSRPATPLAVTDAERDSERVVLSSLGVRVRSGEIPDVKPIVRRIVDDHCGHVYVFAQEAGVPEGTTADVFEDTGKYLGRLELPETIRLKRSEPSPHATCDHLYLRVTDAVDVEYVSRLRISR